MTFDRCHLTAGYLATRQLTVQLLATDQLTTETLDHRLTVYS